MKRHNTPKNKGQKRHAGGAPKSREKERGRHAKALVQGLISITSKGTGYIRVEGREDDLEVDFRDLNTALHGDTVEASILPVRPRRRVRAAVERIILRSKTGFAGVLERDNGMYFLKPDDTKMYTDLIIPEGSLAGARPGDKVYGAIAAWHEPRKSPEGKILKVLGRAGDNDAEMHAIAIEKGFDSELARETEHEAEQLRVRGITESDLAGRRDFRDVLTFTIDPSDAKDFDDALSFRDLGGGLYEVGIHIADVSHYVKPGSRLDREARERGTSVYLVDRTIPMLPEVLSNDLCSLVPRQDRLTMSAVFTLDKDARVHSAWYGRTVIHSKKRFAYEEAEEAITDPSLPYHAELAALNAMAKAMTRDRFSRGAVSLDQEEVKFVLDASGRPLRVIKKARGDSNRLIEEFMLLANQKVAEFVGGTGKKSEGIFVYRVHDLPSKEKMADLAFFLRSLGYHVSLHDGIIPSREINSILVRLGKQDGGLPAQAGDTVHRAVIRSMAKAVYSTKNIGHYGLALRHYTHFTSPIRRYPDIMVHRMLAAKLEGRKAGKEKEKEFEASSRIASEQEKRAADAERASVKYKQVEYMMERRGQEFKGIVSGITEWGLYVEEVETKCEGMVRTRDLEDDIYVFNEKKMELVGEKTRKRYRLGDRVGIIVRDADLERKTIDYALV